MLSTAEENVQLKEQINQLMVANMVLNDQTSKLAEFLMSLGYSLDDLLKITVGVYSVN